MFHRLPLPARTKARVIVAAGSILCIIALLALIGSQVMVRRAFGQLKPPSNSTAYTLSSTGQDPTVVSSAANRLAALKASAAIDVCRATKNRDDTVATLRAIDKEQEEFAASLEKTAMELRAADRRLRPEFSATPARSLEPLRLARQRLNALDPGVLCSSMKSLRNSFTMPGSAMALRLGRYESFVCRLSALPEKFHALESAVRAGNGYPEPRTLANELNLVIAGSWEMGAMQASLQSAAEVVRISTLVTEAQRAGATKTIAAALLSVNSGRMGVAVESLDMLLTALEDPANKWAKEAMLDRNEMRIKARKADTLSLTRGPVTVPLSDNELTGLVLSLRHVGHVVGTEALPELIREAGHRRDAMAAFYEKKGLSCAGLSGAPLSGRCRLLQAISHSTIALQSVQSVIEAIAAKYRWQDILSAIEKAERLTYEVGVEWKVLEQVGFDSPQNVSDLPDGLEAGTPAQQSFLAFRADHISPTDGLMEALTHLTAETRLVRLWYGDLLGKLRSPFWEHLQSPLYAAWAESVDQRTFSAIQARRPTVQLARLEKDLLVAAEQKVRTQITELNAQRKEVRDQANWARTQAPHISLANARAVSMSDLDRLFETASALAVKSGRDKTPAGAAIISLQDEVSAARRDAGQAGLLSEEHISQLRKRLAEVAKYLPALDSTTLFEKSPGRVGAAQLRAGITAFKSSLVQLQARLAGLSAIGIHLGFQYPLENSEVLIPLSRIPAESERNRTSQIFVRQQLKNGSWLDPMFALQAATEMFVVASGGVMPLAYGLAGVTGPVIRVVTYPNPFPISGLPYPAAGPEAYGATVTETTRVKIPGIFSTTLGGLNGILLGTGTVKHAGRGVRGELRKGEIRLDRETFGKMQALIANMSKPLNPARIYLCGPGCQFLIEFTPQNPQALTSPHWQPYPEGLPEKGVFRADHHGNIFEWGANRLTVGERTKDFGLSALAGLGAAQIADGLPHNIDNLLEGNSGSEMRSPSISAIDRVLDGAYLAGLVTNGRAIARSAWYKFESRRGGYGDAPQPRFTSTVEIFDTNGQPTETHLTADGRLLVARKDGGTTYLDTLDGTVVGRLDTRGGLPRLLRMARIRSKYQDYIESRAVLKAGLHALTSPEGSFVPRRKGSARVDYTKDSITIQEGLSWNSYRVGKELSVSLSSGDVRVRPYFASDGAVRGLLKSPLKENSTIPPDKVLTYLPGNTELYDQWESVVREGTPRKVPPVQTSVLLSEFPDKDLSGRWEALLSGGAVLRSAKSTLPLTTVIKTPEGADILDRRESILKKGTPPSHSTVRLAGGKAEWNIDGFSLPAAARTALLDSSRGQWFRAGEPINKLPEDTRSFSVMELPDARMYFDIARSSWAVNVRGAGNRTFDQPGIYYYQPGILSLNASEAGLNQPFRWEQELPAGLTPKLGDEFDSATDIKIVTRLSGTDEVTYSFNQIDPRRAPLTGTFVVRTNRSGTTTYRVGESLWGIDYKRVALSTAGGWWTPSGWPRTGSGITGWQPGNVPAAIAQHLRLHPGFLGQPHAEYAVDLLDGRYLLRIVGPDGNAQYFEDAPADTSSQAIAWVDVLPEGIPDTLIASLPEAILTPDPFHKRPDGLYEHRQPDPSRTAEFVRHLESGGATVLPPESNLAQIRKMAQFSGRVLIAGTGDTVPYGRLTFHTAAIPLNDDWPEGPAALFVLSAAEPGRFVDPRTGEEVQLALNQIILVQPGGSLAEIKEERDRLSSPRPAIHQVLQSIRGVGDLPPLSTPEHLPAYLGLAARAINGQYVPEYRFFEVGDKGGEFEDPVTHTKIVLPPHSDWALETSPVETANYLGFNQGRESAWALYPPGWHSFNMEYMRTTKALGIPNELVRALDRRDSCIPGPAKRDQSYRWQDKETKARLAGYFVAPRKADPGAPVILEITEGGEINDPFQGKLRVNEGDTLLLQVPHSLQLEIARAQTNASMMVLKGGSAAPIVSANFNETRFSGIRRIQDLDVSPTDRQKLPFPFPDDTLVQMDQQGGFSAQVLFEPPLLRWVAAFQEHWGYVSIKARHSCYAAVVNAKSLPLCGLVGIADGRDDTLPTAWVRSHQTIKKKKDERDASYLVVDGNEIGEIYYGIDGAIAHRRETVEPADKLFQEAKKGPPYQHEDALFYLPVGKTERSGKTYTRTLAHALTHQRIRETRTGEALLTVEYLNSTGKPLLVTHFDPKAITPIPTYSTDGAGHVIARYGVVQRSGYLTITTWAPDGSTLLRLADRDQEGKLLREWNALNNLLEENHYDAVRIGDREINSNGKREGVTRSELFRVLLKHILRLDFPALAINPYAPPGYDEKDPAWQRLSARSLDVSLERLLGRELLGTTYYSPVLGKHQPIYHLTAGGKVDEVYETHDQLDTHTIDIYRLSGEAHENSWNPARIKQLLDQAKAQTALVESRDIDPSGRVKAWRVERRPGTGITKPVNWLTKHDFVGESFQLSHSSISYNGVLVTDIYYPGFQTLDEALRKGIGGLKLDPQMQNKAEVNSLIKRFGTATQQETTELVRQGYGQSAEQPVWESLQKVGLAATTTLQVSLVSSFSGGISVAYRLPEDVLERSVMVDLGGVREISTEWEGKYSKKSTRLSPGNSVMGVSESEGPEPAGKVLSPYADAYRGDASALGDHISLWHRMFGEDPSQLIQDYSAFGLTPDTPLRKVRFAPRKLIQGGDGPIFSAQPSDFPRINYVLPYDPLGNYLVESDEHELQRTQWLSRINLWWMQADKDRFTRLGRMQVPPADISPGNIGVQDSVVGRVGHLTLFAGRDEGDRDQQETGDSDPKRPHLAQLKPHVIDCSPEIRKHLQTTSLKPDEIESAMADVEWLRQEKVEGYWYDSKRQGNYLEREFHLRNSGRLYIQQYRQILAYPLQSDWAQWLFPKRSLSREKRVYLDTRVPWFKPILATNKRGEVIAVWGKTSIRSKEGSEGEEQIIELRKPLSGEWVEDIELTDANGFPAIKKPIYEALLSRKPVQDLADSSSAFAEICVASLFLLCGVVFIAALWIHSRRSERRWERFRREHIPGLSGRIGRAGLMNGFDPEGLFDNRIAKAAMRRISRRVLTSPCRDGEGRSCLKRAPGRPVYTANGIAEGDFLFYIYPIFAVVMKWRLDNGATLRELNCGRDDWMDALDRFAIDAANYLVHEYSIGQGDAARGGCPNERPNHINERLLKSGVADPHAWEKMFSYLQRVFLDLREAMVVEDPTLRNKRVNDVLNQYVLNGDAPFNPLADRDEYKTFLKESGWERVRYGWSDRVLRFIGFRTKSIHIYLGQEYADHFPLFLSALVGIGFVLTGSGAVANAFVTTNGPWFLSLLALVALGAWIEWPHMSNGAMLIGQRSIRWRILSLATGALAITIAIAISRIDTDTNAGTWMLKVVAMVVAAMEAWGHLGMAHSPVGLSVYYHFRPTIGPGRTRVVVLVLLQSLIFMVTAFLIANLTFGWWTGHAAAHIYKSLYGGFVVLVVTLYLIHYGTWSLLTAAAGVFNPVPRLDIPEDSESRFTEEAVAERISAKTSAPPRELREGRIAVVYAGNPLVSLSFRQSPRSKKPPQPKQPPKPARTPVTTYLRALQELRHKGFEPLSRFLNVLYQVARQPGPDGAPLISQETSFECFITGTLPKWLTTLRNAEYKAKVPLLHHAQVYGGVPDGLKIEIADPANRACALLAAGLSRILTIVLGSGVSVDTAFSIIDLAEAISNTPALRGKVTFIQTVNKYEKHRSHDLPDAPPDSRDLDAPPNLQTESVGRLFSVLAGQRQAHALTYNWSNIGSKSAGMNGIMLVRNLMSTVRVLHVLDRNCNILEIDKALRDYSRMLTHPEAAILTGFRNTSNTIESIGRQNEAIEGGHGAALLAVPDKIGTGWANLAAVPFWQILSSLSHPKYPVLDLTGRPEALQTNARYYGLVGFAPNGLGQSEDLWSVFQQTHNLIGLGAVPEFGVTESAAVKLRERHSAFAVSTAGSRWSGGLVDTLRSPIHQVVSFFGPESVFERKARRNAERVYLSAPIGLFSIAFIFFSIFNDMNPFIGIQMMFWLFALFSSQALTFNGLSASCRAKGIVLGKKAVYGALVAAVLAGVVHLWLPGLWLLLAYFLIAVVGGMLYSPIGFSFWARNRLRDIILFAPRYFMEAASVLSKIAGGDHSFASSGKGDEHGTKTGWQRLKELAHTREGTWYWPWIAFVIAVAITLEALTFTSVSLDFGNIILMWIILAFASGGVTGFFSGDQRPGKHHPRWSRLSTGLGTLFGFGLIVLLYWTLQPDLSNFRLRFLGLLIAVFIPGITYFVPPLGRLPFSDAAPRILRDVWVRFCKAKPPRFKQSQPRMTPITDLLTWERVISNFRRACFGTVATFGWFGVVPIPDNIRFALLPPEFHVATMWQIAFAVAAIGLSIIIMSKIGDARAARKQTELWDRFSPRAIRHYQNLIDPQGQRSPQTSKNGALIMYFLVKMGTGHWADAEEALKQMGW